jgi:hypothetical protein
MQSVTWHRRIFIEIPQRYDRKSCEISMCFRWQNKWLFFRYTLCFSLFFFLPHILENEWKRVFISFVRVSQSFIWVVIPYQRVEIVRSFFFSSLFSFPRARSCHPCHWAFHSHEPLLLLFFLCFFSSSSHWFVDCGWLTQLSQRTLEIRWETLTPHKRSFAIHHLNMVWF